MSGLLYEWFFFFQAEDGIRDGHVTGVQTCALPIYAIEQLNADPLDLIAADARGHRIARGCKIGVEEALRERTHGEPGNRSEERRVGKSVDRGGGRTIEKKKREMRRGDGEVVERHGG